MGMEEQELEGDRKHKDAQDEDDEYVVDDDDDDAFIDAQASLPSDKVAQEWINAAGGIKKGHVYGLGSHCTVVCNYSGDTCQITPPQHALPQPTPNAYFVGTPGFKEAVEEAVNRAVHCVVDKKMSKMSLSIWHDIFVAIRSLGESTPTFDRHASSANSYKNSYPNP